MTPPKHELEAEAKRFANIVFAVCATVLIFLAFTLRPLIVAWVGPEYGEDAVFISVTILILVLSTKRPDFALIALRRQCRRYGHERIGDLSVCQRCFEPLEPADKA